jgi:hypothetical protein
MKSFLLIHEKNYVNHINISRSEGKPVMLLSYLIYPLNINEKYPVKWWGKE